MNTSPTIPTKPINQQMDCGLPDRDALLQASRRVDWRFLLPQPDLGEVAYVGQADQSLIASLRQFCTYLSMIENEPSDATHLSKFPVAVAINPNKRELVLAVHSTCPGGFVYVEVSRHGTGTRNQNVTYRLLHGANHYLSAMRRLPLSDLQVHWHWPNFETCSEMIPFHDRAAGICALRRRGSGIGSRWKSSVARLLLESHLLINFVPCFSILGRKM